MAAPLTIGFLTPYSGIYPFYAAHLSTGWLIGMGLDPARQQTVRFIPEYTHSGSAKHNEDAARKLIFFDRVDVLSGLVGYRSIETTLPIIENAKGLGFFFDMGEYIPHFPYLSDHVFYASHQLWQSQYALGVWAQGKFGEGGHIVMPVYEGGYHLHCSFLEGAKAAGGGQISMTILPFREEDPLRLDLEEQFKQWESNRPAYVHAIFCGTMAVKFMELWIKSPLHKKVPLLLHEATMYDDMLDFISGADTEFYTARSWLREDESLHNSTFVQQFETIANQPANIFALMGYEAGLAWKELLPYALKKDWNSVKHLLRTEVIKGPRGDKNFFPQSGFALPDSNILRISTSGKTIRKIIVDQGKGMRYDAKVFSEIHENGVSGWQNPFLCI
ncbi:ABC transporter substrate-binding protein [Chitinophaga sp. Hz27]|uniref:ABC transporter substrate-binding protein n=1 Tax=Chitinophaga sp. Hz27 TaxID=3347169 RepID=UPI0035E3543F